MKRSVRRFVRRQIIVSAIAAALASPGHAALIGVNSTAEGSVSGMCTLQDAVTAVNSQTSNPANSCGAGDGNHDEISLGALAISAPATITFTASTSTVAGVPAALLLTKPVTLSGAVDPVSGNPLVTLQRSTVTGTPEFSLIASSQPITVDGLAFKNGKADYGGAINFGYQFYQGLTVMHSAFIGNNANIDGGALRVRGYLQLSDSTFSGNGAPHGGAVYTFGSAFCNVTNSSFDSNTGSALVTPGGNVTGSHFTRNSGSYGGAIDVRPSSPTSISRSTFIGNTASKSGGAINLQGGSPTLTDLTLSGNTATQSGGAIAVQGGSTELANSTVSGNSAALGGGGAYVRAGSLRADQSIFSGNSAGSVGGAIHTPANAGHVTLANSTLSGNRSTSAGGGVYGYSVTTYYSTVFANAYTMQPSQGAGIFVTHDATSVASILSGNGNSDIAASVPLTLGGRSNIIISSSVTLPNDTLNCDAKLGPLGHFGGATKTLPLLAGSCAIEAASSAGLGFTSDQRGLPRPNPEPPKVASLPDIGAFEKQADTDPDLVFLDSFGVRGAD